MELCTPASSRFCTSTSRQRSFSGGSMEFCTPAVSRTMDSTKIYQGVVNCTPIGNGTNGLPKQLNGNISTFRARNSSDPMEFCTPAINREMDSTKLYQNGANCTPVVKGTNCKNDSILEPTFRTRNLSDPMDMCTPAVIKSTRNATMYKNGDLEQGTPNEIGRSSSKSTNKRTRASSECMDLCTPAVTRIDLRTKLDLHTPSDPRMFTLSSQLDAMDLCTPRTTTTCTPRSSFCTLPPLQEFRTPLEEHDISTPSSFR